MKLFEAFANVFRIPDLRKRVLFALAMLAVYRLGGHIPTPGAGPHNHAGLMLVASGKGTYVCIGIPLTSPQPAGGVAVVPLSEPDGTSDVCVAWRKGETSPIVHQFLNCVSQLFPQPRRASAAVPRPSRRAS